MINPVAPFYEFWLTFYNGLPSPFRSFVGVVWGLLVIFALIRLAFSAR